MQPIKGGGGGGSAAFKRIVQTLTENKYCLFKAWEDNRTMIGVAMDDNGSKELLDLKIRKYNALVVFYCPDEYMSVWCLC